jgi:hypothetical protein
MTQMQVLGGVISLAGVVLLRVSEGRMTRPDGEKAAQK